MAILIPGVLLVAFAGLLIWRVANRPSSLRQALERWARANGLTIVKARRRYLLSGPFFWKRAGIVFKIEVRLSNGGTRAGWIKFGYDLFAREPWSESVIWDDEALEMA